jgi:hypothetical protein
MIRALYINDVTGLLKSTGEANFIGNMAADTRSFDVTFFQVDAYPDSKYLEYAQEFPDLFNSIQLSMMSVNSSEKEARSILASINDGTRTFEEAATAQSQDVYADRGGDMGVRYIFELKEEITETEDRDKIINLGKDELSDVIRMGERWAFFRVEDELKPANIEDEIVMDKVKSYMRNYEGGRLEDWAIEQARNFIADVIADDFDTALVKHGKGKNSFGPIPINYGSVDIFDSLDSFGIPELNRQELSDLSKNENFWKIAFSTPVNTPSEPLVQGGKVLVLLPTEQIESDESSIEGIASTYSSYWLDYMMEQSLYTYFLNSPKMDNRFFETYFQLFNPMSF